MSTTRLAGNSVGGVVQGNYGTYQAGSDGVFTVDTRDVPAMLLIGMSYLRNAGGVYTLPKAPVAASAGHIAASAAMSNGAIAIANQPDVARAVNVILGNGSPAITAGNVAVTYKAQDGGTYTDNFAPANLVGLNGSTTVPLSRGVLSMSTIVISAMAGGGSPWIRLDDTNLLGLPSDPGGQDFAIEAEYDTGTVQASPGTPSTSAIGTTSVVTTPNGTVTFSFLYAYVAPTV